ncbi:G2/mitotic-specific cyclin-2 [Vitis vinifera]|uniref:G2/mitotic-specific cyclin-2 n=1 Tax=Vitis vinifera TaxID=29760 RepID=A0A438I1W7_VITVI|nr:G2/mitotic-specific cyclin-2 [Vitis vinifera]
MASRVVPVPNQPRGGKQKNAPEKARNRQALREIGNLMNDTIPAGEGTFNPQISRPLTRSCFCSWICPGKARKKPKPQTVVTISPDENDKSKPSTQGSLTKKVKTLSSILTTQSKMAACRLTDRPRVPIINIDADDVDNELAAVEYVDDIYQFYKMTEDENRTIHYMDLQTDINSKMRAILIDWLVEVHRKLELMPETLYLTINIIDRYLSTKIVSRSELQLVGITSMLIACNMKKFGHQRWCSSLLVNDFVCISDNAYDREQILQMEKSILTKLEWYLTVPTPYVFLVRYIKASVAPDQEMEEMVFFLTELGLMNYSTILYSPSVLAASAVYAARCTLRRIPLWSATLKHYTGYTQDQLMDCAKLLVSFHLGAAENKLKAVYQKFSELERGAVAHVFPAKNLSAGA